MPKNSFMVCQQVETLFYGNIKTHTLCLCVRVNPAQQFANRFSD